MQHLGKGGQICCLSNISSLGRVVTTSSGRHLSPLLDQPLETNSRPSYSTAAADDNAKSSFGYCVSQVRRYDQDNYVWMTQMPKHLRPGLFVVRAFNCETALVSDQVKSKEPALMQMRYQWWREAIGSTFKGSPPTHPLTLALAEVLKSSTHLKKYNFTRLIDAREADVLDTQPPLDVKALEVYAESTASQLLYMQLAAAGVVSREADHAASHIGKAVGLATLLRGTAHHAAARRSYMPLDLCVQYGVSQEDIYSGNASDGLRDVALKVASIAKEHLEEGRSMGSKLPRLAKQVLLPAVAAHHYLTALEKANFNLFEPSLLQGGASPLRHLMTIKYHMMFGTF
ncbi:MAG: hypothetical protein WDW38_001537 [Sanguina aurantia]